MYVYAVIIIFQTLIVYIKCHDTRDESVRDINSSIDSMVNKSVSLGIDVVPFSDQEVNTSLLPPIREFTRHSEDKDTDKSKILHQLLPGVYSTSLNNGANHSNQASHNGTRNRNNDARFLPTTTTSLPVSIQHKDIVAPHSSADVRPQTNHRSDTLCSFCGCTEGDNQVYCEHKHISKVLPCYLNITAEMIPKNAKFIRFKDFERLHIEPGTFQDKELKLVTLEIINIPDIILEENSLSFNSKTEGESVEIKIKFENCSFTDIKNGAINQIGIINARELNEINLNNVRMLSLDFK
ncbi:unnamed protein product, partial [Meganyctiphanes norvegica]